MNSLQLPAVEARIAAEAALFTHSIGVGLNELLAVFAARRRNQCNLRR